MKKILLVLSFFVFALVFSKTASAIYALPGMTEEEIISFCSTKKADFTKKFLCDLYTKISFVSNRTFDNEQRINDLSSSLERKIIEINSLQDQINFLKQRVSVLEQRFVLPIPQPVPQPQPLPTPIPVPVPGISPIILPINP